MRGINLVKWFVLGWICLEIMIFVWVADLVGIGWMLLLILASTFGGILLLRQEGFRAANVFVVKARNGERLQASDIANTPLIMLGGILLVIPGFISDAFGLLCLLPPVRQRVVSMINKRVGANQATNKRHDSVNHGRTFDGEYRRDE